MCKVLSPLRLVVQAGGGMQVHHLVVLHSQVVPSRPRQMRNLCTHILSTTPPARSIDNICFSASLLCSFKRISRDDIAFGCVSTEIGRLWRKLKPMSRMSGI